MFGDRSPSFARRITQQTIRRSRSKREDGGKNDEKSKKKKKKKERKIKTKNKTKNKKSTRIDFNPCTAVALRIFFLSPCGLFSHLAQSTSFFFPTFHLSIPSTSSPLPLRTDNELSIPARQHGASYLNPSRSRFPFFLLLLKTIGPPVRTRPTRLELTAR